MDDEKLWEDFKKTGRVADYLRYRGVDIYAAQNAVRREEPPDAGDQGTGSRPHHRGPHYPGI